MIYSHNTRNMITIKKIFLGLFFVGFILTCVYLVDDYFYYQKLDKYYDLVIELHSKGYDIKDAKIISAVESGLVKPNDLYYETLNHQKKVK